MPSNDYSVGRKLHSDARSILEHWSPSKHQWLYEALKPIEIVFDKQEKSIGFVGKPSLLDKSLVDVFELLALRHAADMQARISSSRYSYVSAIELRHSLGVTEVALRQRIARLRFFFAQTGDSFVSRCVVESVAWRGYRLNPAVRIIDPEHPVD